ncbi:MULTISPECIES: helix-turn-helix domain-containing protein [unclassified Arthrobacter]|uniref:helix-turn-helix domain-containing protein n=1 Tax=unclassified Arthrobacter TaxID=235627 RepID=UPI000363CF7E|nr:MULTISPECIES: helix-turn-helix domain-containing protein [unclassified Arthrobacter]BCW55567.1 transcriptional regulator [Arthrobacter sp. StoSoilB19]BCW76671.1 transcriptional regulator [Arthrobacter sp. NicSoilB11]
MTNLLQPEPRQRAALAGHERLDGAIPEMPGLGDATPEIPGLRKLIRESWLRSAGFKANPDNAAAPLAFDWDELEDYRRQHPLAAIMPVINKLLVQPSHDSGLLVAVGDEVGRLLWVDGDPTLQRRAEGMMFVPGADWSEASVGTSAPGTALALGKGIQIAGAEHYQRAVHPWSCTAVPFHDPDSGAVLGVVDITGTATAVAPHTLSLVEATVAAAQAQLRVERLQRAAELARKPVRRRSPASAARQGQGAKEGSLYRNSLQLLGRDQALLSLGGRTVSLSARHSEILALLSTHPDGLTAEELSALLYPGDGPTMTLRAEMVRLRKVIQQLSPDAVPGSRPYRLPVDLVPDTGQVLSCLQRGAHRIALEIYRGGVLPRSEAPGIIELRNRVSSLLREAVLTDGSAESLLKYAALPEASDDVGIRRAALRLLPPRSPKRAAVVADLERLEAELRA